YLELEPAQDFDDELNMLTILFHHVPSVTSMPVFLGRIDKILIPYVGSLTQEQLYPKLKRFWRYIDRTLPDAFMHANIG
ncbi:glycyl radical enzyme domain-containing protein, partial [Proteus mirabilis]|uniref:glycyl radical enzyme domain-containing protein n=1 Tax=Proteus mirabilis TaxID=584 RepID=UPI002574C052